MQELRERIAASPESDRIANAEDDSNLIRFLRARKYDMDKALESTIEYRRFLDKMGDVLAAPITKDELLINREFLEIFREPNGGKVYVVMRPALGIKAFTKDRLKENPRLMMRINFWLFDYLSRDPQCQIAGMVIMNTLANFTFWDNIAMSNMAPMGDQIATFQLFNILGTRLKGAFIFEQPTMMSVIWFLARPFMSTKIQERFHLCGSDYSQIDSVCADKGVLPTYLGGTLEPGSYPYFIDELIASMP